MITIKSNVFSLAYIFLSHIILFLYETQHISPLLSSLSCQVAQSSPLISFLSSCLGSSLSRTTARTEIGRAGLRNPTPYIQTPAWVCGQSSFWRASSATARYLGSARSATSCYIGSARSATSYYIVFFLVNVRGTALRTSSCIDCGPLLQATHYVN